MSNKKEKKDEKSIIETIKPGRRKFIKNLSLIGTGVIVYSSPIVSAANKLLSQVRVIGGPKGAIDVQLPATYDILEPSNWLEVQTEKGLSESVEFSAKGSVALYETKDPNIAQVELVSLRYNSVSNKPLSKAGFETGTITAQIPNKSIIGMLDLKSGILKQNPITVNVSCERTKTMTGGQNPGGIPVISSQATVGGDKCCIRDIKVDLSMTGRKGEEIPSSRTSGKLSFRFKPIPSKFIPTIRK